MNLPPQVFDADHVARIRSELSMKEIAYLSPAWREKMNEVTAE